MNIKDIATPSYIVDEGRLESNLEILKSVIDRTGCRILLAQKCFSMYAVYPLIGEYISGCTASGLNEARLGFEEMGKENHVFSPAYRDVEFDEIMGCCDHIIFNSVAQLNKFRGRCTANGKSFGLRINPECSTQGEHAIYDPCAPGSRLGVTIEKLEEELGKNPGFLEGVDGFHFHTLCEQDADDLECTFYAFEEQFASYLKQVRWLNLGGGHHITRPGYQIERLKKLIGYIRETYGLAVYLEPGEAVALNAGYLVTEVCDIVHNGMDILILDASAACHMPDVLEMPYRPPLRDGFAAGEQKYTYRLSSLTCLAGDVIGDYSFTHEIQIGDRLVFEDMAIYSMVKNNTFNGIPLPSIAMLREDGEVEMLKQFGYEDFKGRLS